MFKLRDAYIMHIFVVSLCIFCIYNIPNYEVYETKKETILTFHL